MKTNIFTSSFNNIFCRLLLFMTIMLTAITESVATTTWTGAFNSNWNIAGNWSAGLPNANQDVIIPSTSIAPIITAGSAAVARTLYVQVSALLTIQETGSLTLNGSVFSPAPVYDRATLINVGAIVNNGTILINSTTGNAPYGIVNLGSFTNQQTGIIDINRISNTALLSASGIFTNKGKIDIGSQNGIGPYGLWNDGSFINTMDGTINVDRSSIGGIVNNSHSFNTAGIITIGANADVGENGIENRATLTIETCAKTFVLRGKFYNETAKTTTNYGLIQVTNELVNKGTFTNNGVLKYLAVTGSISNKQIVIGNTPAHIFNYPNGFTGDIQGIFKDADATPPELYPARVHLSMTNLYRRVFKRSTQKSGFRVEIALTWSHLLMTHFTRTYPKH